MPSSDYYKQTTATYYRYIKVTGTSYTYIQEGQESTNPEGWHTGSGTTSIIPVDWIASTSAVYNDANSRMTQGGIPKPPPHG